MQSYEKDKATLYHASLFGEVAQYQSRKSWNTPRILVQSTMWHIVRVERFHRTACFNILNSQAVTRTKKYVSFVRIDG